MNKRIFTLCLALALCLSLIPAAVFADESLQDFIVIRTGIAATDVSMMGNGLGSYKILNESGDVVSKGVADPSGNEVITRTPQPGEGMMAGDATNDTHYAGVDSVIVDLMRVRRYGDYDGTVLSDTYEDGLRVYFDWMIYDKNGDFLSYVSDILAGYEGVAPTKIQTGYMAYFGQDGYLTAYAYDAENVNHAYIIDLQKLQVVFRERCNEGFYGDSNESWYITSVNDGLVPYNRGQIVDGNYEYIAAGWMDVNGNHKLSIDQDKYFDWYNFSNDRAMVSNMTGLWYGYIDRNGKEVIPCVYSRGSMFKGDYAYVMDEDSKYGYIDTAGNTVIPFEYDSAYGYGEGLFAVGVNEGSGTKYGLVDEENNVVVPLIFDDISYVRDDTAYAVDDGELVIIRFNYNGPTIPRTMEKENGDVSSFEIDPIRRIVTVKGSQSASEPVLIASYDENGRFLEVKIVMKEEDTVSFDRKAESLLLLAADGELQPMAEAVEVDLTAPVEQPPIDDVILQ